MGQAFQKIIGGTKMKRVAIITGGTLPLPAIKGGAIETLLQFYIDFNEKKQDFALDIYSIYDSKAMEKSKDYRFSKFKYIKISPVLDKLFFNFFRVIGKLGYHDPNFRYLYIKKVCQLLKNEQYDLILIESDNHFVLPIKNVTESNIVLYLHNDKLNSSVRNHKKIADACVSIQTVSEYIQSQVRTADKTVKEKVEFLLNGIDTEKFLLENKKEIRRELRSQYNISEKDFVFLFTGRLDYEKGILELVKSFKNMNRTNAKLMILGGSFYSSTKKTKFVKMLENEIASNSNIIVTGYINNNDIPKYHAMADCMVVPSQWEEPGSLVNLECFASGLPLISSACGGTPQYTKDTKTILVNRGSNFVKDLSIAMKRVMDDQKLRTEMTKSGLKQSSYFSKERYCDDLNHYLNKLVK